jgi:soluble lytic murein transglycosylase-like protein
LQQRRAADNQRFMAKTRRTLFGVLLIGLACGRKAPPVVTPESVVSAPHPTRDEAQSQAKVEPRAVDEPVEEAEGAAEPTREERAEVEVPQLGVKYVGRILAQQELVAKYAGKYELDADLVNAVIWVESKFDRRARGPAGAMGLMQLMPRTAGSLAKRLKRRSRPYDPDFNIEAGCLYLHRILTRFDGDERLSLAAYNRGVGRVKSWVEAGEELPERTAAYVDRVLKAKAWIPRLIEAERPPELAPEPGEESAKAVAALDLEPRRGIVEG